MTDQPMRCDIDLDWCTYRCPCGQELCARQYIRINDDASVERWLDGHKSHTNGKVVEHTTADGMRAWGNQSVPDVVRDL